MGRKGKPSNIGGADEGAGKWSRNGELRDIASSLNHARKTAYDHQWIEKKKIELTHKSRKKLIFPHFSVLLNHRARNDDRERIQAIENSQRWSKQLHGHRDIAARNTYMNAKMKFYQTLQSEYSADTVPSLSRLCINTIAENLENYAAEDIKYAISTVDHRYTELLSLLSSVHCTLYDEQLLGLTHELTEKVFLSKNITDAGITAYFAAAHGASKDHFSRLDSWEQIDLFDVHITSCMNLKEVTLLSCSISTTSWRTIDECCRSLQRLCMHDMQFAQEGEVTAPAVLCLQVLGIFAEGFLNLVTLEVLQCPWVRYDAVNLWASRVLNKRQNGGISLPKLSHLTLSDFQELGMHHNASREAPTEAATAQPRHATAVIEQLIDYLHTNCAIELTILPL